MAVIEMKNMRQVFLSFSILLALAAALASGPLRGAAEAAAGRKPRRETLRIYCFGDSITRGINSSTTNAQTFRYLLSQKLTEKFGIDVRVYDGGIGGQDTTMADARFADVAAADPDVAIIMFGANDAAMKGRDGEERTAPRVPVERYRANIERWIDELQQKGTAVILMTPPPTTGNYQDLGNGKTLSVDQKSVTKKYAYACREMAIVKKVDLVDNFKFFTEADGGKNLGRFFISDGIHLNPAGNAFIADNIMNSAFLSETSRLMSNPRTARFFGVETSTAARAPEREEEVEETETEAPIVSYPAVDYTAIEKNDLVNLAAGKSYIESSPDRKCAKNVLTDGVANVRKASKIYFTSSSSVFPKWVTFDLGKISSVRHVIIYNSERGQAKKIKVFTSSDLESFRQIGRYTFEKDEPNFHLALEKPASARYVRIEFADSYGGSKSVSLNEVEIWGR